MERFARLVMHHRRIVSAIWLVTVHRRHGLGQPTG